MNDFEKIFLKEIALKDGDTKRYVLNDFGFKVVLKLALLYLLDFPFIIFRFILSLFKRGGFK